MKTSEYKKAKERGPLQEEMNLLLPQLYGIINQVHTSWFWRKDLVCQQLEKKSCSCYISQMLFCIKLPNS